MQVCNYIVHVEQAQLNYVVLLLTRTAEIYMYAHDILDLNPTKHNPKRQDNVVGSEGHMMGGSLGKVWS